jgi:hypothetical protein
MAFQATFHRRPVVALSSFFFLGLCHVRSLLFGVGPNLESLADRAAFV